MPIQSYYRGHGREVMDAMTKRYGRKRGRSIFYAVANKRGMKPGSLSSVLKGKK